jgi:hypothetical protein
MGVATVFKQLSKPSKKLPSPSDLWEHFELSLWDGTLVRRRVPGYVSKLGTFGARSSRGYVYGMFKGNRYYAHRLVWLWIYGILDAKMEVDHIDRNKHNNNIFNLRLVTSRQQTCNTTVYKNNKSGYKGVRKINPYNKYQARIRVKGKAIHLGCYNTPEQAHNVYVKAAKHYFGEFACAG